MRRLRAIMMVFCIVLLASGCWDNRDIDHRLMPVVMGVESTADGYKVYLQTPIPESNSLVTRIIIGEGKTINQIIDTINADMESRVDLLHVKILLFDKELAEKGMTDIVAGVMRSRSISSKTLVAICDDDMNAFFSSFEGSTSSTSLLDFFEKNSGWTPQLAITRTWEIYRSIHSYTRDVAIPILRRGETTLVDYIGSAVIKKGEMVGEITPEETLLYNAFNGHSMHGRIEVSDPGSVLILGNSMSYHSKMEGQVPILKTKITFKVMLLETKGNASSEQITKELEEMLTNRYKEILTKLEVSGADILGTGQLFRKELNRKSLKKWRTDYFPYMQTEISVGVDIENTGNLKTSAN